MYEYAWLYAQGRTRRAQTFLASNLDRSSSLKFDNVTDLSQKIDSTARPQSVQEEGLRAGIGISYLLESFLVLCMCFSFFYL